MAETNTTQAVTVAEVHPIVMVLYSSAEANNCKEQLYGGLGLPLAKLPDLQRQYIQNGCVSYHFLLSTITMWVERESDKATRGLLLTVLRELRLNQTADNLQSLWNGTANNSNQRGAKRNASGIWHGINKEPVRSFSGRHDELSKIYEYLTSEDNTTKNPTRKYASVLITGLGGIGKTELSRQFAFTQLDNFPDVIWINAESEQAIREAFKKVAEEELGLRLLDPNKKSIKWLVNEVYKALQEKESLFIFDNIETWKSGTVRIADCLPSNIRPGNKIPYILMTSRNRTSHRGIKVLTLEVLKPNEAMDLIRSCLEIDSSEEVPYGNELSELLGWLPLTMQQALAFIRQEISNKWPNHNFDELSVTSKAESIQNYITNFKGQGSKDLLNYVDEEGDEYDTTTYKTWKITTDKIQETNPHAMLLLAGMAYLGPDNISRDIFKGNDCTDEQLEADVIILANYNMIRVDIERNLNIHRLVQEVTRLTNLEEPKTLSDLLSKVDDILGNYTDAEPSTENSIRIVSHAQVLWSFALKHSALVEKFSEFPLRLYDVADRRGMYSNNLRMLEATLECRDNLTDVNSVKLKIKLSTTFWRLQKYEESIEILRKLQPIVTKEFGDSHELTLEILGHLASSMSDNGSYAEALTIYNTLVETYSKMAEFGPHHAKTLSTRHNKALTLISLGRDDEALALLTSTRDLELSIQPVNRRLVLHTESWIAHILQKQGKNEEALSMYTDIYNERKMLFTEVHAFTLRSALGIGKCLAGLGKYNESLELLKTSSELAESNENNINTFLKIKHEIGRVQFAINDLEAAEATFRDTISRLGILVGEEHPDVLTVKYDLGMLLAKKGSAQEAVDILKCVVDLRSLKLGPDHPETLTAIAALNSQQLALAQEH